MFSIPSSITTTIVNGVAKFENIEIFQGTFLRKQFLVDGSLDQRFLLDNSFIDSSTIVVRVKVYDTTLWVENIQDQVIF